MLQQLFEVPATRFHAATQTFAPLIISVVDDTLLQTGPLVKASSATRQRVLGAHRFKQVREKGKSNITPRH